jgi:hypothetical protein
MGRPPKKKENRGGARENSGRKKTAAPTKTIAVRVPEQFYAEAKEQIAKIAAAYFNRPVS